MAHFLKPEGAPPDPYTIDDKLAPGSLGKVTVPLGKTLEVALWGGAGLRVTSKNDNALPTSRITERPSGDLRILSLYGANAGSSVLETGGSVTLPVTVGAVAGALRDAAQLVTEVSGDITVKAAILATLSDPAISRINLAIDGYAITPLHYAQVKDKINAGKIQVRYNPRLINRSTGTQYAFYHAPTNVLSCGFATATEAFRRGLIVHEATHAACDAANYAAMTTVTSECLGYLAQAIFMVVKIPNAEMREDPIASNAQVLAQMILQGTIMTPQHLRSLKEAIQNSSEYSGKAATPGYNGV